MIDPHNLGTFNSFEEVWDLYPYGGCPGDYVTVVGVVVRWNEGQRIWGDSKTFQQNIKYERIEGNVEVTGDLKSSTIEANEASINYLRIKHLAIDDSTAIMTIDSGGDDFLAWGEEKKITCKVTKGFEDITPTMKTWRITRDSGDTVNDNAWNIAHQTFNGNITLAYKEGQNDLGKNSNISTMFTIFASDQAGIEAEGNLII